MKNVIPSLYPGLNESDSIKTPSKLPTILLWKKHGSLTDKPIEIDQHELLKCFRYDINMKDGTIDEQEFNRIIKEFLKKNN